ncbi:hypothetical protein DM02DRAFT_601905 [Periconia macrospinosa]|uniref:Uncharacterized protein n=1 Tax=Periconia macrospinosa TaxID=97972 RepID=A0A2V1D9J4_9PLEO|nr:hypothetical protein DM02DRAFT_601905 [Periconia macrospinosa]
MAFQATGIWSLIGLGAFTSKLLIAAFSQPLMVRIVFLSQDSTFRMGEGDINASIKGLFHDGECEWLCDRYQLGKRQEGISRSAIHVTLRHRNHRCDDPYGNAAIRDLCRKLVGKHTTRDYTSRVVPEWERSYMTDNDKTFGSCLILMQLKDFHDNFPKMSAQGGSESRDWV